MEALAKRRSIRVFSSRNLNAQDLSDLLWAANGINRPDSGKRTAPSALNRQDIQVYACLATGCYRYDEKHHALNSVSKEDVRPAGTPVYLVLVADEDKPYAGLDAGMVSQNISLFCAGTGLATYPRAQMDTERLKRALKLNSTQRLMLSHPVGYAERVTQN